MAGVMPILTEDLRVGQARRRLAFLDAHGRVELARAVVQHGIGFGQLVALPLLGDHVQELQALQRTQVLQRRDQRIQVMAVDGADVVEAEFLEQRGRRDHALGVLLEAARELEHGRHVLQHRLAHVLGRGVEAARHQPREVAVQRPDGRRDRHVVVVEHHQQIDPGRDAGVVHGLEGHAGGHSAVTDDRDVLARNAGVARGHGHAQRRGNRRGRMRGAEGVVFGFAAPGKTRNATLLAQRGHGGAPARDDLVRIGLVADVPDDAVVRRVEHRMQRQRQFHRAQVGRQVAAGARNRLEHEATQFLGQRLELAPVQRAKVCGAVDAVQ